MNAVKLLPYYTYQDYSIWEGRWELINGLPFAMSPAPGMKHQLVAANIIYELKKGIKEANCKHCKVYDFIDVKISDDTVVQPDCSIVCKAAKKNYLDFPPALAVEILSDSTALKDRHTKFYLYQDFGIKYYLLIDAKKESVEIYMLEASKYILLNASLAAAFTFILTGDCHIKVDLQNIWE